MTHHQEHLQQSRDLNQLNKKLESYRNELHQLEQDIRALKAQKQQLLRALEGQLDLFKDQVSSCNELLKEIKEIHHV